MKEKNCDCINKVLPQLNIINPGLGIFSPGKWDENSNHVIIIATVFQPGLKIKPGHEYIWIVFNVNKGGDCKVSLG